LETCRAAGIAVLAFEAGKTLLLERQSVEPLAKENKISLVAWDGAQRSARPTLPDDSSSHPAG
jgi:hypothetical protein